MKTVEKECHALCGKTKTASEYVEDVCRDFCQGKAGAHYIIADSQPKSLAISRKIEFQL